MVASKYEGIHILWLDDILSHRWAKHKQQRWYLLYTPSITKSRGSVDSNDRFQVETSERSLAESLYPCHRLLNDRPRSAEGQKQRRNHGSILPPIPICEIPGLTLIIYVWSLLNWIWCAHANSWARSSLVAFFQDVEIHLYEAISANAQVTFATKC